MYFAQPGAALITTQRQAFRWGYGHYLILGAAAAVGAGLEIGIALLEHHSDVSGFTAAWIFSTAVAVFLVLAWLLQSAPTAPAPPAPGCTPPSPSWSCSPPSPDRPTSPPAC
ncbi:low temperature requirement protein A [Streptomyces sp. NPDC052687]|uniref:low temperature requirement protein A n=1 Tax=Streptomyces sp. NPDC052687 TaxID=3154759 RepID=UPI00343AD865